VTAAAGQATSRQRGDSSRPVGNSSGVNTTTTRARVGYQVQEAHQAARTPPGRRAARVAAKRAHSSPSAPVTAGRATAQNTQPTALPGRWATIRLPTTMNAVKASSRATVSPRDSNARVPLATASATRAATMTP
jgi:hypothetical protein